MVKKPPRKSKAHKTAPFNFIHFKAHGIRDSMRLIFFRNALPPPPMVGFCIIQIILPGFKTKPQNKKPPFEANQKEVSFRYFLR